MTAIRNSAGCPNYAVCSSYKKYRDNLTKIYFSARSLVRADVDNRETLVPAEFESGFGILKENPDNSRLLVRDDWTQLSTAYLRRLSAILSI